MKYNFDEIIDRKDTDALNYDGWRQYIFKADKDAQFAFADNEFIRMWVADMDFSTPPEVLDAIKARLDRKILGYTKVYDNEYYQIFKNWCQRHYDWEIDPREIVLSPGIIPALNRLVPLLIKEDESILIQTPSYTPFKQAGDYNSRQVIYSDLLEEDGEYAVDFADMERKIKDKSLNIKLFILCNPQNPTGKVWIEEELIKMGKLCIENDIWIISDEIHCDLLRNGVTHTPIAKLFPHYEKVITCMAPSKTFNLAGNLMSHIFIKDKKVKKEWLRLYDDFISPLSLVATKAAYSQCDEWLKELRNYLDDNFKLVQEFTQVHFPKANFKIPDSTYLAWINLANYLPEDVDNQQLSLYFANKTGILLEGGNMFVSNGDNYIRINLACPRTIIKEGLERIKNAL
ncbi:MalY/PatB family protein [Proteus terrae]|uniref:MalY/PatB family protein n=1 Tax=Proteus terrae TaxID=1574161 RepID=UPI0034E423C0